MNEWSEMEFDYNLVTADEYRRLAEAMASDNGAAIASVTLEMMEKSGVDLESVPASQALLLSARYLNGFSEYLDSYNRFYQLLGFMMFGKEEAASDDDLDIPE